MKVGPMRLSKLLLRPLATLPAPIIGLTTMTPAMPVPLGPPWFVQ